MATKNDYVRVRYVVVEGRCDTSIDSVLRFTQTTRAGVIKALNMDESGVLQGRQWLGELSSDYPAEGIAAVAGGLASS